MYFNPILVPLLHHHASAIITDCNRSATQSPRLDLPGFWLGTETKREVWLLQTGFGIAPVNNVAFVGAEKFSEFYITLHYLYWHACIDSNKDM